MKVSRPQVQSAGLALLTHDSPILDVARQVSGLIREHGLTAAVIGGVAVVLHGHTRTTLDVDVYAQDAERLKSVLESAGFTWDAPARQFSKDGVPVHLVTTTHMPTPPAQYEDVQGIRTVSLADLINMKLASGTANVLRAQDLADVIALMRAHALTGEYTPRINKPLRPDFRRLLDALAKERRA
jgi:Nucleotidyltransferase of unknown function (DUF6036)